jgi:hypothetical protein
MQVKNTLNMFRTTNELSSVDSFFFYVKIPTLLYPGLGPAKVNQKTLAELLSFFVYLFIFLLFSLFHLRMMEATVFLGTFNAAYFLVPFPRSVHRHNSVSELYGQFLRPHGLVFAVTCTVNCETLFRQVCAFPNHVQSIEFTTGELQVVETFQR